MSQSRAPAVVETGHEIAGRYVLREIVASGGMASVWEADDTVLGRKVAVKILQPNLAADPDILERFRDEAKAAARLSHPSIVAIYDTASEAGVEAIVMELIEGLTLRQYLDDHGPLSLTDATDLTAQVADALDAAHAARIVHRDIKPGNIMLCPDRRTKVTDFGIAKALEAGDRTSEGVMLGTAKYLAPEQVEGLPVDERADVYSLGVVLFEALTGEPPFAAETASATALARLRVDPPSVRSIDPTIPAAVDRVVLTALARDRDRRYPTAGALRDALHAAATQATEPPPPSAAPGPMPPTDPTAVRLSAADPTTSGTTVAAVDATPSGPVHLDPGREPTEVTATEPAGAPASRTVRRAGGNGILVSLLVLGALALGVGLILGTGAGRDFADRLIDRLTGGDADPGAVGQPSTDEPTAPAAAPRQSTDDQTDLVRPTPEPLLPASRASGPPVVGIEDFDPLGDGEERPDLIDLAADGDRSTAWVSEGYINRRFGNLKDGVGVVIRIDGEHTLQELAIESPTEGWAATVFAADDTGADLEAWGDPLDARVDMSGNATFDLRGVRGSAILLWITDLGDSTPRARMEIAEIAVS